MWLFEDVNIAQDMPAFSILCLDASDMPQHQELLWLSDSSIKLGNVKSVDRREMARATGLEIEKHEAAKWGCSSEDKKRAAVLAAAIISNHWSNS
jgi:hypothetical protein